MLPFPFIAQNSSRTEPHQLNFELSNEINLAWENAGGIRNIAGACPEDYKIER
jgi:hypothetical protein